MSSKKNINYVAEVVNNLFRRMKAISPAFKQAWPTEHELEDAKKEWLLAFIDAGIDSTDMIQEGLKKLRMSKSPFVPSPGQFIDMCDIWIGGAPPINLAFDEAIKNYSSYTNKITWSHKCVKYAAIQTGSFEFKSQPRHVIYTIFKDNYEAAIRLHGAGKLNDMYNYDEIAKKSELRKKEAVVMPRYQKVISGQEALNLMKQKLGICRA